MDNMLQYDLAMEYSKVFKEVRSLCRPVTAPGTGSGIIGIRCPLPVDKTIENSWGPLRVCWFCFFSKRFIDQRFSILKVDTLVKCEEKKKNNFID